MLVLCSHLGVCTPLGDLPDSKAQDVTSKLRKWVLLQCRSCREPTCDAGVSYQEVRQLLEGCLTSPLWRESTSQSIASQVQSNKGGKGAEPSPSWG